MMRTKVSASLYKRACRVMVGGVSSPVRAFKAVGGEPLFIACGKGSKIRDVDGNSFVDYVCSWGALILGHADPSVEKEVLAAMSDGTSFGASTESELRLAEKICSSLPSVEMVRFVNSGTEATMSALRLARAYTGRSKFMKFDGCYHGHADPFLTKAGSGMATLDLPASSGVTKSSTDDTATLPYNDVEALEGFFANNPKSIAAVIVEPVAGNMGVVPAERAFLEKARELCTTYGALLIFDEVITGFRVSKTGAQGLYGVKPDLTCLGKIIGGGFPVGAYGGRHEVMRLVSPEGPVYQAGTLSGNPVAMVAGLATLSALGTQSYARLERMSRSLAKSVAEEAESAGVSTTINRVGSMVGLFLADNPVTNFAEAKRANYKMYGKFFWAMLRAGVYLPPSAFETIFVSLAHSEKDLEQTVDAARKAFAVCTE